LDKIIVGSWYEQHKNGIYRYALSITKDPYLAEDVLHDAFVKLMSKGFQCAPGKELSWLYRIARNLCYDQLRRNKREQGYLAPPIANDTRFAYIELISGLSPTDREIVTLKIVGGLSHAEIGAVLGISHRAAQKRYERAINSLKEKEEKANGTKAI